MPDSTTFFNNFISQKLTGIPYSTQWLFTIDGIPGKVAANNLTDIDTQTWAIRTSTQSVKDALKNSERTIEGNIFAQTVTLPREDVKVQYVGVEQDFRGGYMPGPIVQSRSEVEPLEVQFLETRNSFLDLVVRPWVILVGYQGLLPPKDAANSIKTTLTIRYFDRGDPKNPDQPPSVRKQFNFYNAAPIYCDSDTTDYQKNIISVLKTRWVYTHYTVESISAESRG